MSKLYIYSEIEPTIKLLDKINMTPFFRYGITPQELMDLVEQHVEYNPELSHIINDTEFDYFKCETFNWLTVEEFMDYIEDNYGVRWEEYTEYRLK